MRKLSLGTNLLAWPDERNQFEDAFGGAVARALSAEMAIYCNKIPIMKLFKLCARLNANTAGKEHWYIPPRGIFYLELVGPPILDTTRDHIQPRERLREGLFYGCSPSTVN